jgi:hypothetical protein
MKRDIILFIQILMKINKNKNNSKSIHKHKIIFLPYNKN